MPSSSGLSIDTFLPNSRKAKRALLIHGGCPTIAARLGKKPSTQESS
jgi:hypothetical protein